MNEPNRRTGRTTRIVDQAIQDLFKDGIVTVSDHPISQPNEDYKNTAENNINVARLVVSRLYYEHGITHRKDLDIKGNIIKLL